YRPVVFADRVRFRRRAASARAPEADGAVAPAELLDTGPLLLALLPAPVRVYDSRSGKAPDGTDADTGATDVKWVRGTRLRIDVAYVLGDTTRPTGVPPDAQGVALNVTATSIKYGGRLMVWSGALADSEPPATSSVNWSATSGQVNSLVLSRCGEGRVHVELNGASGCEAEVIIDVVGYLAAALV
ncbi:MAG: hypothetical protein ACKOYG_01625, partial [Ilumatobacteraceae bacterium]